MTKVFFVMLVMITGTFGLLQRKQDHFVHLMIATHHRISTLDSHCNYRVMLAYVLSQLTCLVQFKRMFFLFLDHKHRRGTKITSDLENGSDLTDFAILNVGVSTLNSVNNKF